MTTLRDPKFKVWPMPLDLSIEFWEICLKEAESKPEPHRSVVKKLATDQLAVLRALRAEGFPQKKRNKTK